MSDVNEESMADRLLKEMVKQRASDLHIKAGSPPICRVDGSLVRMTEEKLYPDDTMELAHQVCPGHLLRGLDEPGALDFAYSLRGVARFRVSCFHQRGAVSLVFRVIKFDIPPFEELNLPGVVKEISESERGIVLVTGVTGSGKSTTLASMIDHINSTRSVHVVTIEDPIEYLHRDRKSIINQVELGVDTLTLEDAVKRVLRQDPDVILIGEMRDKETIRAAVVAAETGHLVFSTLHTADAIQTVDRILKYFDSDGQDLIRMQLSLNLRAVISQRLLPKRGGGRIPAVEILCATPIVQKLIFEGRTRDLKQAIQNAEAGMQTFNQSLVALHQAGMVTFEDALAQSDNQSAFRRIVSGGYSDGDRQSIVGAF